MRAFPSIFIAGWLRSGQKKPKKQTNKTRDSSFLLQKAGEALVFGFTKSKTFCKASIAAPAPRPAPQTSNFHRFGIWLNTSAFGATCGLQGRHVILPSIFRLICPLFLFQEPARPASVPSASRLPFSLSTASEAAEGFPLWQRRAAGAGSLVAFLPVLWGNCLGRPPNLFPSLTCFLRSESS